MKLKTAFLLLFLAVFQGAVFCQEAAPLEVKSDGQSAPSVYLGVNGGINHIGGLMGVNAEIALVKNLTVQFGAGIGSWGTKISGTLRYYKNGYPYGMNFFGGYGRASGISNYEMEMEDVDKVKKTFTLNLKPASVVNLGFGYQWKLGRNMRFGMDFGYAIGIDGKWEVVSPVGSQPSTTYKNVMDMYVPGGIIIGLAFSVGLQ